MMPIDLEYLIQATGARRRDAERFLPFIRTTLEEFGIDTPLRIAGFLSQIGHESGGLARLEESLNYSVEGLLQTFGRHRISEADARRLGRAEGRKADQAAIANLVYGGSWGEKNLGNSEPGDGWRFRGRGLKQLTGRANYAACGAGLGIDLLDRPERLLEPECAARSAGWFWSSRGLNALADSRDVTGMTKLVNGGNHGLAERKALFAAATRPTVPAPAPGLA